MSGLVSLISGCYLVFVKYSVEISLWRCYNKYTLKTVIKL